jgi:hypothetical protein
MIGTRASELWQQVNIELNLPFTDSHLRAATAIPSIPSLFLRAMYVTPRGGIRGAQQLQRICAKKQLAAREGIEEL